MKLRPFQAVSDEELRAGAAPEDLPVDQDREVDELVNRFAHYRELDPETYE